MADQTAQTFWNHLDELRSSIIRMVLAVVLLSCFLFFFKTELFAIVLAPKESSFITYRILSHLTHFFHIDGSLQDFQIDLINTQLASQFIIHVKVAFAAGFIVALPYILYLLFSFVAPALYETEKRNTRIVVIGGYLLFIIGALLSYFLIFPLTFRFLGTYQVSDEIRNIINLESYIDTFFMLCAIMGILFEMPIIAWLLAKLEFIKSNLLRKFRRHAIVVTLIMAAIITPTSDVFTLTIVSIPIYLLYEISTWIVQLTEKEEA